MRSPPARRLRGSEAARPPAAMRGAPRLVLGAALVLIALNLRPVFSSLAALLPEVMQTTGLQPGAASLVTALPVLCLGLFAPFAPVLAARFGAERTITGLLVLLAAGTAVRGFGTVPALLAGAVMTGAAIAIVNVLLPSLVKRDFPDRLALMTGLFTMALSAGAAAAAGLTVPLRSLLHQSWPLALAAWAAPAVLALALWLGLTLRRGPGGDALATRGRGLWGNPLAWQVTMFMGLQSAMAYAVFGFLAPILRERGMEAGSAGLVVSWSVAMQCVACLSAPAVALRRRRQSLVNVVFFGLAALGFAGCVFAPLGLVMVCATLQGLGQGGLIALAMTAIVLRSANAGTAASLSSMAQSVGYTLASGGPLLVGVLRQNTGGYVVPALFFIVVAAVGAVFAWGAGRDWTLDATGPATLPPPIPATETPM